MTAPAVADPGAALGAYLRAQVGDLLFQATYPNGARLPAVFRPSLPSWFDEHMPAACLVIRRAGGYTRFGKERYYMGDPRMDILAYAANDQEATDIAQAVAVVCKQLDTQIWEDTLLWSANVTGGPTPLPDSQTLWPSCWLAVQLVHGELPVAPSEV